YWHGHAPAPVRPRRVRATGGAGRLGIRACGSCLRCTGRNKRADGDANGGGTGRAAAMGDLAGNAERRERFGLEKQRRILAGDRPTGSLHLGHWVGSISHRVRLQDEYECFFIIADWHTLTTRPEKAAIAEVPGNIREMVLDYL